MIKIENLCYSTTSFAMAIQGMRNPMNSWDKSDSGWDNNWPIDHGILISCDSDGYYEFRVGPNDQELMLKLAKAGSVHAKYRRMITVYADITAPLYWWKEFDTYVANSCSTMHKIHSKEFTLEDFSVEHLFTSYGDPSMNVNYGQKYPLDMMRDLIAALNRFREEFIYTKDKKYWWQMIQLLPSSYNQKRTVMLNYEVLAHMYHDHKDHKLDEWRIFCETVKDQLPLSELFIMDKTSD